MIVFQQVNGSSCVFNDLLSLGGVGRKVPPFLAGALSVGGEIGLKGRAVVVSPLSVSGGAVTLRRTPCRSVAGPVQ